MIFLVHLESFLSKFSLHPSITINKIEETINDEYKGNFGLQKFRRTITRRKA
jgi:hypothetical protein